MRGKGRSALDYALSLCTALLTSKNDTADKDGYSIAQISY
ncbi:hypothetical protein ACP70R_002054 [Stipagrostis hirtigluma subsp. patula]